MHHTTHSPEDGGASPAERPFNARTMGEIIHGAYGINFDGTPTPPKTLEELEGAGYSGKEISMSLKTTLLQDTMETLAAKMDSDTFLPVETVWRGYAGEKKYDFRQPQDLLGADGTVDLAKRSIYLRALIANEAQEQWLGPYRAAHPEAFEILYELNQQDSDEPPEEVSIMDDAADTGVDSVLALHRRIELTDPTAPLGASMVSSLPALTRIAAQNGETTGSSINLRAVGFTEAGDTRRETELRGQLRQHLQGFAPDTLGQLKAAMMESFLDEEANSGDINESRVAAIQNMDNAFADPNVFLGYLCGDPLPEGLIPDDAAREYYDTYRSASIGINMPGWLEAADITAPAELQDTLIELEAAERVYALSPEYFTVQQEAAGEPMRIQLATVDRELGRAAEKLFRQPVFVSDRDGSEDYQPADTVTPVTKTVRCAAMYANLATDNPRLQEVCDTIGFHPAKMNGIAFLALLDLMATHQALVAAKAA